eukprot:1160535-Pelagomonas_calceolata.AAC.7
MAYWTKMSAQWWMHDKQGLVRLKRDVLDEDARTSKGGSAALTGDACLHEQCMKCIQQPPGDAWNVQKPPGDAWNVQKEVHGLQPPGDAWNVQKVSPLTYSMSD